MAAKSRPVADAHEAVALMQSAPARGRGRKSPVLVWLAENRETIAAGLTKNGPAWGVLAAYLAEKKILDGDGRPPSARNVREAWARVQAASQPALQAPWVEVPAVRPIPQPAYQPVEAPADKPSGSRFQPAELRNHTPAAPQPSPQVRPAAVKRDADAEIARLLGSRPQRTFPSSENEE